MSSDLKVKCPQTRFSYLARTRRCSHRRDFYFIFKNSSLLHVRLAIAMVPTTRFSPKSLVPFPCPLALSLHACSSLGYSSGANTSCLNWNRNSSSHLPSYSKGGAALFIRHNNNHSFSFLFVTFAHCMDQKGPNSLPFL
jgi:hypothetical protein